MKEKVLNILGRYKNNRSRLMDILLDVQGEYSYIPEDAIVTIADILNISKVDVEQTISFYHFFSTKPVGKYAVYLNDSAVSCMKGRDAIAKAFEDELGISFNSVTDDGQVGLWNTSDIGMNDQEPAALINGNVFTSLTADKVKELVAGFKAGKEVQDLITEYGDGQNANDLVKAMVKNNIMRRGPVVLTDYKEDEAIKKIVNLTPEHIIDEIKKSNLRGRGGAGFPTGLKWEFCRRANGDDTYLVCNADEGEPGTFKERVILTEEPQLLFEGMVIAGYALAAKEGILYLRYEYKYLKDYLESVLQDFRDKDLLGENIAGKQGFNFDIRIQLGAGAYVCGEESALIESMEGKRGEPRNRPPYPVQKGYMDKPTVINNVETLCKIGRIMINGSEWFKAIGTKESTGTKLLSISGDCEKPGVYEIEWGMSINDMLDMVGAENVQAVQMGGPSGACLNPNQFGHKIAFEDMATGGSVIVISKERDLLREFVVNFTDFFIEESCSSCAPCRSLTVILRNKLQKILDGKGIKKDIDELYDWSKYMKLANRCGLGQTAANPITSTIENFRQLYEDLAKSEADYTSTFNMEESVAESCGVVDRVPNL